MIRFINLTGQMSLDDDDFQFAWYDTIVDRFLEYNGNQTWFYSKDFETDLLADLRRTHTKENIQDEMLGRFRALYPHGVQTLSAQNGQS